MSLRMTARLLNRPLTTVRRAVDALGLKPQRVGMTCYFFSWQEIEQLDLYLRQPRRRRTHG